MCGHVWYHDTTKINPVTCLRGPPFLVAQTYTSHVIYHVQHVQHASNSHAIYTCGRTHAIMVSLYLHLFIQQLYKGTIVLNNITLITAKPKPSSIAQDSTFFKHLDTQMPHPPL